MRAKSGDDKSDHDLKIRALAETLAREIAEQVTGGNLAEAAALVEEHLIGMRQGERGRAAMAASPDVQRILDQQAVPPLPPGWQTGSMRAKERGGDSRTRDKKIRALAETLAREIAEQMTGGNLAEATALVEENLIGMRHRHGKGRNAVAASPDAQRILSEEETRWRKRATRRDESSPGLG